METQREMEQRVLGEVRSAADTAELERLRVRYLGKKGELTARLRSLGELEPDQRPEVGRRINEFRRRLEEALQARQRELAAREEASRLKAETLDVTLPGVPPSWGRRHPLRQVWEEIEDVFLRLGFDVAEGPEVETEYYNFEALNIPADHPARDMQDSFYLHGVAPGLLLRTQTSPVQIRYMQQEAPRTPLRMVAPGRVYRRDQLDASHSPVFHQVEGLVVGPGVSLADLKGVLSLFAREIFGPAAKLRFRPSYFPFTEPSAEVDVSCPLCGGRGCRTCSGSGWLEILGCGMVHPRVLREGGYDSEEVAGFAFGMGIDRIAMLRYGIDDLRLFTQNDLRFLRQF